MARQVTVEEATLALGGMTCGHCVATVEKALLGVAGVRGASVDLASQSALVEYDPASAEVATMESAVAAAGYAPRQAGGLASLGPVAPAAPTSAPATAPATTAGPALEDHRLSIEGMTCASCVRSVEQAAMSVPGVSACDVSLTEGSARVRIDATRSSVEDVVSAVRTSGYGARLESVVSDSHNHSWASDSLGRRLAISATLTIPLLVLAMSHGLIDFAGIRWVQLALALPVVLYGGGPFYAAAWNAARHGRTDMNTLIAVGTGAAFAYSVAATAAPDWVSNDRSAGVYFETAAAILTLVLLGRVIETRARERTSNSIRKLMALQAKAVRIRRNGAEMEVALDDVAAGDEVLVHPGDRIPVDGTVLEGTGAVDESPITGESVPADKGPGSRVVSGSLNKDGFLVFRAESVGAETALSQIIEFVRRAQGSKAPAARLADRIAAVFVPIILGVAAATFAAWMIAGPPEERLRMAWNNAVSVLIIACPCALGLATPAALAVGIGRAAENGILIRDGGALEVARNVDTVVFDKTGTLTLGKFTVTDVKAFGAMTSEELLEAASAIERRSEHPIARGIASARPVSSREVSEYRALPGAGASACFDGATWLLGKREFLADGGTDTSAARAMLERFGGEGKTVVLAARDGDLAGVIALRDTIRPEAIEATAGLHDQGVRTVMISGDNAQAAKAVASEAGVQGVLAPVMPIDKSKAVRRLQSEGRTVAMVGDGINDAPALTQADLGIAIGAGTDVAVESARIVLVRNNPADVGRAIELAKRTQRTIKQNYWWAFGYNALGVPIAAGIFYPWTGLLLSPILASAAMALSSLSVISNSLRLNRVFANQQPHSR